MFGSRPENELPTIKYIKYTFWLQPNKQVSLNFKKEWRGKVRKMAEKQAKAELSGCKKRVRFEMTIQDRKL